MTIHTAPPTQWKIVIPAWMPHRVNEWEGRHWSVEYRMKKEDAEFVAWYALIVPKASGRRRVSLEITLLPGKRRPDPDGYWDSLLDGLVKCGLLRDDGPRWCEQGGVTWERGEEWGTAIILQELPDDRK